jgi:hypothetical protein
MFAIAGTGLLINRYPLTIHRFGNMVRATGIEPVTPTMSR